MMKRILGVLGITVFAGTAAAGFTTEATLSPGRIEPGGSALIVVKVIPLGKPDGTGVLVTQDLGPIGDGESKLYDDGTHGDEQPRDLAHSLKFGVPAGTAPGVYVIKYTASDGGAGFSQGSYKLTVAAPACSPDFDGDGEIGSDADIAWFFSCLAGDCCETCVGADYNGDGDVGDDKDIASFFSVLAGGAC
jgi:hypothetical protein